MHYRGRELGPYYRGMQRLTHPDRFEDYSEPILKGEAAPSVHHSLVAVGVRDNVVPDRLVTLVNYGTLATESISAFGAALLLFEQPIVAVAVMAFAYVVQTRLLKRLGIRLAYCAVLEPSIGEWGTRRGFLSLLPLPSGDQAVWLDLNERFIDRAARDLEAKPSHSGTFATLGLGVLLALCKVGISLLLIHDAYTDPGWLRIVLGGSVAVWFVVQSILRLVGHASMIPLVVAVIRAKRRDLHG